MTETSIGATWEQDPAPEVVAMDRVGNPVCPGCHEGGWEWAARGNSGMQGLTGCGCPVIPRGIAEPETRADATRRIITALDQLDALGHPFVCRCPCCEAALTLRGPS